MRKRNLLVMLTPLFYLSGCATKPPQVMADVDLVQPYTANKHYIDYKGSESTGPSESVVSIGSARYKIVGRYVSARGHTCHQLMHLNNISPSDKTGARVCQDNEGWFLVPALMDRFNEV